MNKSSIWPLETDTTENWAFYNGAFSKEECQQIIKYAKSQPLQEAYLGRELKKNIKLRKSKVSWLTPSLELQETYKKLTDIVTEINNKYFNFDLYGFGEAIQFTQYKAPGGKYGKHIDKCLNGSVRKLSLIVQLTDPEKYEGGDINLYINDNPIKLDRTLGNVYLFPSYVMHEVTPVTKGERCSLVAWLTGPRFK